MGSTCYNAGAMGQPVLQVTTDLVQGMLLDKGTAASQSSKSGVSLMQCRGLVWTLPIQSCHASWLACSVAVMPSGQRAQQLAFSGCSPKLNELLT